MGNDSSKKGRTYAGSNLSSRASSNVSSRASSRVNLPGASILDELYSSLRHVPSTQLAAMWDQILDKHLLQLVIDYLSPKSMGPNQPANRERFYTFFQLLVRGTPREGAQVVFQMLKQSKNQDTIVRKSVTDYVESLIRSYLLANQKSGWDTTSARTKADVVQLEQSFCADLQSEPSDEEDLTTWMLNTSNFTTLQQAVFIPLLPIKSSKAKLHPHGLNCSVASLLSMPLVVYVNYYLPAALRKEWRMLYSTRLQGESFSKLLECITKKGPTLLVVKDKGGSVFGAYAPASWALGPKFFGDNTSFLFRIKPNMCVYSSTGYNANYQYLNMGQQTMPNGLGFGGQLGYFGLWLDGDFGRGSSSESCTTYRDHRTLSTAKEFAVDGLEVWALGPEEVMEEEQGKRSVLDSNTEARAMLDMMGKKAHSDGYREPT